MDSRHDFRVGITGVADGRMASFGRLLGKRPSIRRLRTVDINYPCAPHQCPFCVWNVAKMNTGRLVEALGADGAAIYENSSFLSHGNNREPESSELIFFSSEGTI